MKEQVKNMRNSAFCFLILCSLTIFSSCKEEFEVFEGGEFNLLLNKPINLIDGSTLELKEVEDSRCPEGQECIWEGRAAVEINWLRGQNHNILLNDVEYISQTVEQYRISLQALTPYPNQNNSDIEKIARIRIELN